MRSAYKFLGKKSQIDKSCGDAMETPGVLNKQGLCGAEVGSIGLGYLSVFLFLHCMRLDPTCVICDLYSFYVEPVLFVRGMAEACRGRL